MTAKMLSLVIWLIVGGLNLIPKNREITKIDYGLCWFCMLCLLIEEIMR